MAIRFSTELNLTFKKKILPHISYIRYYCSKDDNVKDQESSAENAASIKNPVEKTKRPSVIVQSSRYKPKPVSDEAKEAAKQKLMSLLSDITAKSDTPEKSDRKLNIATAVKRVTKIERYQKMQDEIITPEKKMDMAVKAVASNFKDDSEKIQSELTEKLSSLDLAPTVEIEASEDTPAPGIDEMFSDKVISSVEEVTDTISENPIPSRSELTERLMNLTLNQKLKSEQTSVRSVIEGMVIKPQAKEKVTKFPQERISRGVPERRMAPKISKSIEKINLFGAQPLNIFEPGAESKPESTNTFWQKLQERELRLLTQFAPNNAFEEMIMWTEQGKHWKLPIDNETEMGAEENVGFHEHVFLEHHLKGFPTKGPIRHFMELVCVGLSKNPYITVERKVENIEWFRNYFKEKEEILRDAGTIE